MSSKMFVTSFRSADRDQSVHPDPSDFVMSIGRSLDRVREIRLGSIEMPVTQNTVEDTCSKFYYDEGIRVDVGELQHTVNVQSGGVSGTVQLWNHQFTLTENHGGTLRCFVITVPPHLLEIECQLTGTLNPSAAPNIDTHSNIPHGLGVYQQWALSTPTAPEIIGVAASTVSDIVYSSSADVVPITTAPINEQFQVLYTANVLSNKLAFLGGGPNSDAIKSSFIHCPALHAHELASFLTTATSLARDKTTTTIRPLNQYTFEFSHGRFQVLLNSPMRSPNGVSTDPRLWFPTTPNSVANTPNNPTVTSLGHIMGLNSGMGFSSQDLFSVKRNRRATREAIVANLSPRCFTATMGNGFYDPSSFATALVNEQNWGNFSNTTSGVPHTVFGEFGYVDSLGDKHTILLRSGKYFPHELAAALAFQMTFLDGANIIALGILNPAPVVTYTGTYDPTASTFTFSCADNSGMPLDFSLAFDTSMFISVTGIQNTERIAHSLGFDPAMYSGSNTYTGKVVNIPRYTQTLSSGPTNGVVRPLAAGVGLYSNSGPVTGETGGPAAFQYATNIFRIIGTNPNQKRFCPHQKTQLSLNETTNPGAPANGSALGNYVATGPNPPGLTDNDCRHVIEFQSKVVTVDTTGAPPHKWRSSTGPLGLQVGDVVRFFENPEEGATAGAATVAALKVSASGTALTATVMKKPQTGFVVEILVPGPTGGGYSGTNPGTSASITTNAAVPSNVVDGARVRVRIANDLFWTGANHFGYNLDSLQLADPPRFQIHHDGRQMHTGKRQDAVADKLGVTEDLYGAGLYLAPSQWNLDPTPYVLLMLSDPEMTTSFHTHHTPEGDRPVLAKLIMSSPYTNVHNQIMQMGLDGYRNLRQVRIQILNPDYTPYQFHGRNFTMSLCFVIDSDDVSKPCI